MGEQLKINRKTIKIILALIILAFVVVFILNTDFAATKQELNKIGFKFIYLISITFLAYFFGTWSWHVCLGNDRKKISLIRLFAVRQVGETVGQFNPTSIVGGDLLKAEMLKPYGISSDNALSAVATSRITTVLSQILLFLLACLWLNCLEIGQLAIQNLGIFFYVFIGLLILSNLIFFYWLIFSKSIFRASKPIQSKNFIAKLIFKMQELMFNIRKSYRYNPKSFWLSYFLATIHWLIGSLEFYLILLFLGFDVIPMHGLLLDMGVIVFKSAGAFIPGQLGFEELGNKIMLQIIAISNASVWISASILRRARQLFWIAMGFILYLFIKKDSKQDSTYQNGNIIC
ncbi:lysylphosphatidylglycerol synthase transmembrane domain-containing protein [Sphingobacterium endophyticum]|uniref:lysylphosphatidylglycerol synthase transmembrane domain-containing protein n=1 Tax=Sphingobacterium endophyticum TaxID=2546448 RepID=UPI0012E140E0|nr:lysylphosphatidylglycerol synthase transmembrane domain-containing protein [Sphingobacterium endophyticum]